MCKKKISIILSAILMIISVQASMREALRQSRWAYQKVLAEMIAKHEMGHWLVGLTNKRQTPVAMYAGVKRFFKNEWAFGAFGMVLMRNNEKEDLQDISFSASREIFKENALMSSAGYYGGLFVKQGEAYQRLGRIARAWIDIGIVTGSEDDHSKFLINQYLLAKTIFSEERRFPKEVAMFMSACGAPEILARYSDIFKSDFFKDGVQEEDFWWTDDLAKRFGLSLTPSQRLRIEEARNIANLYKHVPSDDLCRIPSLSLRDRIMIWLIRGEPERVKWLYENRIPR